jgi:hypothetical protein
MTEVPDLSRARPHDLGGQVAGPVDRTEHEPEPWQNLVTALMYLLRDRCRLAKTDELRRAIEDLKPEDYRRLGYFDKMSSQHLHAANCSHFASRGECACVLLPTTAPAKSEGRLEQLTSARIIPAKEPFGPDRQGWWPPSSPSPMLDSSRPYGG